MLVDPTENQKWIKAKAERQGVLLKPLLNQQLAIPCPEILKNEINNPRNAAGWSKCLDKLPKISINSIETYHTKINQLVMEKAEKIKKPFRRGNAFLSENYLDEFSIYTKQSHEYYCIKGVCAASLKKLDRWIFVAINKESEEIQFMFCKCRAGKTGTCAHAYALIKLIASWSFDNIKLIPEPKACTSKPCTWSVPQSRDRVEKLPIQDLTIKSQVPKDGPPAKKRKPSIKSSLFDARLKPIENDLRLLKRNPNLHAASVINEDQDKYVDTLFGKATVGSCLSYQCSLMPHDFNVYCSYSMEKPKNKMYQVFPTFPFSPDINFIADKKFNSCDVSNKAQQHIINILTKQALLGNEIEEKTKEQANSKEWFEYRKYRFTASLFNQIGDFSKETAKGLNSLAQNLVFGEKKVNKVLETKMSYGKFYEPVAIQMYERFLETQEQNISVEDCGLVIDTQNVIFGATPDGKVIHINSFGIIEVKCPEQFKDVDPKNICFMSTNPCVVYDKETETIHLSKKHSYYSQIQMQLALTTKDWCDFILYTGKGVVIDRILYDPEHWKKIQKFAANFYFEYMLPRLALKYMPEQ